MSIATATRSVFELTIARAVEHPPSLSRAIHVTWRAPDLNGRAVQVYLDGQLAHVVPPGWPPVARLHASRRWVHRVDLLAVAAEPRDHWWRPWLAHVDDRGAPAGPARVDATRSLDLPFDAAVEVDVDGQPDAGSRTDRLWSRDDPRGGFGDAHGEGGFGYDAATGLGLGRGALGHGPLGLDGEAWRWSRQGLDAGPHQVQLRLVDRHGQALGPPVSLDLTLDRPAPGPTWAHIDDAFNLHWTP